MLNHYKMSKHKVKHYKIVTACKYLCETLPQRLDRHHCVEIPR